jgi:hypothetical protein
MLYNVPLHTDDSQTELLEGSIQPKFLLCRKKTNNQEIKNSIKFYPRGLSPHITQLFLFRIRHSASRTCGTRPLQKSFGKKVQGFLNF